MAVKAQQTFEEKTATFSRKMLKKHELWTSLRVRG